MRTIGFGLKWSCYAWLLLRFSIDKPKVWIQPVDSKSAANR